MPMSSFERERLHAAADRSRLTPVPAAIRELTRDIVTDLRAPEFSGECVYCGRPTYGRACHAHRDLIQIENQLFVETDDEAARHSPQAARTASSNEGSLH